MLYFCDFSILKFTQFMLGTEIYLLSDGFVGFLNNHKSTHIILEFCDFSILKFTQFMPGTEIYLLSDGLVGFLVPYD